MPSGSETEEAKNKHLSISLFCCCLQESSRTSRTSFFRTQKRWLASQICATVLKLLPGPFPCQGSPTISPLWTHGSITARWQRAGRAEVWMEWNVAGACELKWLQFTFSIIYGKQFLYCFAVTSHLFGEKHSFHVELNKQSNVTDFLEQNNIFSIVCVWRFSSSYHFVIKMCVEEIISKSRCHSVCDLNEKEKSYWICLLTVTY